MKRIVILFFAGLIAFELSAQAPGNVTSRLRWWLKADAGVYRNNGFNLATEGQAVQQWNDQSSTDINARQTTTANKPIYATDRINGYPALLFSGNQFLTALSTPGINSNEDFSMFLVFKQDSYLTGSVSDGDGSYIVDRSPETENLMSFKMVDGNKYNYQKRNNSGDNLEGPESATVAPTGKFTFVNFFRVYGTNYGIYVDGKLNATSTSNRYDAIAGPTIQLGRHAVNANQGLYGELAEVILYDDELTTAERRRIESYLAIKYGMEIDQTTLTNYVRSDGTTIYPVASTSSYNAYKYDIAGIGRDDDSGLVLSASQSQNAGSVVRVSNPSLLSDNDFLMWGSDNGTLITPNSDDVDKNNIERRLSRVWRARETGNIGTVTISFDLSDVPGNKVGSELRLLIDRDGDGFSDNDVTPMTGTLSGNIFTVTGVNFSSGDYFTIGTINTLTTPLPIELAAFDVTAQGNTVVASWKTVTEKNNDFFTLEKSQNGTDWKISGHVEGAGNSQETLYYELEDNAPFIGRSYYRLRQTDFDGQFTYSDVKSITMNGSDTEVLLYPNPNKGEVFNFSSNDAAFIIERIDIFNAHQQKVLTHIPGVLEGRTNYSFMPENRLDPGLYMVMVWSGGAARNFKVVVKE